MLSHLLSCLHLDLSQIESFKRPLSLLSTPCLKNCAKLLLSELRQISINFDNFWQKGGKEAKIVRGALNFHVT